VNTKLQPDLSYDWVVLHKGKLQEISRSFLDNLSEKMIPVYADEVFILWSSNPIMERVDGDSIHLRAFFENLARLDCEDHPEKAPNQNKPVLPDQGRIDYFADLSEPEFKEAMNKFWRNGGYVYETLRDKVYYSELDRYISEFIGNGNNRTFLDLACGIGRLDNVIQNANHITGIDISDAAIEIARERYQNRDEFSFEVMNAQKLDFPDATFDVVLFVDAIEHVQDATQVFKEISRVTKSSGDLLLTVANKNSLNQIITRKLGYQEFVTNYQHIQEFAFQDIQNLLDQIGFDIVKQSGLFLYPYWGVPGIDDFVRNITDHDAEVVETMRILGERVGPEYAYAFIILARKRASISQIDRLSDD
jgi:ubiquinone/menaquinone biosynthesis C-methylase UbiE